MKTIYLDREKLTKANAIVDIKEYYEKYSLNKRNNSYSMLQGAPFVINVNGTYVSLTKLAVIDKEHSWLINQYITELKCPTGDKTPFLCFKWSNK